MAVQWPYGRTLPQELGDEACEDPTVQDNDPDLLSSSDSDADTTNEEGESETDSDREAEDKSQITQPSPGLTTKEDIHAQAEPKTEGDLEIQDILGCGCEVMTCQFSNDGNLLAVGLADGSIKVCDASGHTWDEGRTGSARVASETTRQAYAVVATHTWEAGGASVMLRHPGTEKGELIQTLRDRNAISSLPITSLRFRQTGQKHCTLLATYASGTVRCWYVWGGQCVWKVEETREQGGSGTEVNRQTLCLSVSPSGERAVTGGSDSAIHLYDLNTHRRVQICKASSTRTAMDGHAFRVFAVSFHPDKETQFISGGWDNTVQFWDTRQQQAIRMISGPHVCGDALDIDPSANQIVSGSWRQSNTVEIWDYDSGTKVADVPQDSDGNSRIYSCRWFARDQIIAAGGHANMLRVINRNSLKVESKLFGLSSAIFSTSISPCGKRAGLIAASAGDRVFLLDRNQRVQGVPLMSWIAQNWSAIAEFRPDPSDLLLSTYPKAGTTWTQEIVDLLWNNGDAEFCKRAPTAVRSPFLEIHSPPPVPSGLDFLKSTKPPRLIKTHLPMQLVPEGFWENKCKVIYVARNAKDNLVSYYYFDRMNKTQPEPGPWEEYIQKFMKGKLSWGSWYDHVKGYWREKEKKGILYLFFEDMKENPRREILRIMRYLDLSLPDDIVDKIVHLTSFKLMKENPMANYSTFPKEVLDQSISPFMRKGEVGDWANHFTPAQSQMFDEDYKRQMADVDIPFRSSI